MPRYTFKCSACGATRQKMVDVDKTEVVCHDCHSNGSENQPMFRQLPSSGNQQVTEVIDSFTNIRNTPDQKASDAQRKQDYFWEVEVPRMVQHYSIETCLEEGWLVYNDKGELVINKPPSKR